MLNNDLLQLTKDWIELQSDDDMLEHDLDGHDGANCVICRARELVRIAEANRPPDFAINELKRNWLADPCYDIETAEGFEAVRDELLIYRLTIERDNYRDELHRHRSTLRALYDLIKP